MQLAVTSCSNPALPGSQERLPALHDALAAYGYQMDLGPIQALASTAGDTAWRWDPQARATLVNQAFADHDVAAVLDISGGDLAGEVLPYLDFETIRANPKPFVGYSDNSCVIGALPIPALLWSPFAGVERGFSALNHAIAGRQVRPAITPYNSTAAHGNPQRFVEAPWVGGNLRCFLKLAGTRWWPDFSGKVLLIEALGGDLLTLAASLAQHRALGTFGDSPESLGVASSAPVLRAAPSSRGCLAVVVGQLTRLDQEGQRHVALQLIAEYAGHLPIFEAPTVGHSSDSDAVTLG